MPLVEEPLDARVREDRGPVGDKTERAWQELQAAMRALEAAEATRSKALYRTAAGVVAARAGAFEQALRALLHVCEE